MTIADYLIVLGFFIGAWGTGFATGLFMMAVRKVYEKATGAIL